MESTYQYDIFIYKHWILSYCFSNEIIFWFLVIFSSNYYFVWYNNDSHKYIRFHSSNFKLIPFQNQFIGKEVFKLNLYRIFQIIKLQIHSIVVINKSNRKQIAFVVVVVVINRYKSMLKHVHSVWIWIKIQRNTRRFEKWMEQNKSAQANICSMNDR